MNATTAPASAPPTSSSELHLPTLAAIGVLAYLIANVAHELVGHGGACLLAGGRPLRFSSAWLESDTSAMTPWGVRFEAAAGTLMNLLLGALAYAALPFTRRVSAHAYAFTWLLLAANLFPAGGYLMVSPLAGFGDWSAFVSGLEPRLAWKLSLTLVGVAASFGTLLLVARTLEPFLGRAAALRRPRARRLCWTPYLVAGAFLFPLSAALNPLGPKYVLTTLLAHLGGSAWLPWSAEWVRGPRPESLEPPLGLPPHRGWLAAGALGALALVLVLGPGVRLGAE